MSLLFAGIMVILFSFVGGAIDYGRWHNANSRTVDALDAALLAGARTLQVSHSTEDAIAVAEKAFLENAKRRLQLSKPSIKVKLSANGEALEGVARGRVKTPFLGLLRIGTLEIAAASTVGFSIGAGSASGGSDLEISMMLDVTGSMCSDGSGPCTSSPKMDALKAAASDLVNIVMKNTSSASARIALVPFSKRIRLGSTGNPATEALMKKVTNLNPAWTGWYNNCDTPGGTSGATSEEEGTWTCGSYSTVHFVNWPVIPCVTDRTGAAEASDAAPGPNTWVNANDGGRATLSWDSSDTPLASKTGGNPGDPADHWNHSSDGLCYDIDEKNIVMPLTDDKPALLNRINDLVGFGSTAGALGTAWSWYTLSPNWAGVWPASSTPGTYADMIPSGSNPPKLRKIAVLMTDGLFNTTRSWIYDPANAAHSDEIEEIATRTKTICTNMKAQGIEIYTVGFDLNALPPADKARAISVLETCGTDLAHFYEAINAEQLKQSFRDIAMQLSQLYVAR